MEWFQMWPELIMGSFLLIVLFAVVSDTPSIPSDCNIDEYYEEEDRLEKRRKLMEESSKARKKKIKERQKRRLWK